MMGVRIVLADKEPIAVGLRRLRKSLERHGVTWEVRQHLYFAKDCETRRRNRFRKRFKSRLATLRAKEAGKEPTSSIADDFRSFWKRTGKP